MKKETAEQLKCRIIDYLLQKHPDMIIGNEIMFGRLIVYKLLILVIIKVYIEGVLKWQMKTKKA